MIIWHYKAKIFLPFCDFLLSTSQHPSRLSALFVLNFDLFTLIFLVYVNRLKMIEMFGDDKNDRKREKEESRVRGGVDMTI